MYDVANAMRGILIATMMIEVLTANFINIQCERILIPFIYLPTYFGLNSQVKQSMESIGAPATQVALTYFSCLTTLMPLFCYSMINRYTQRQYYTDFLRKSKENKQFKIIFDAF